MPITTSAKKALRQNKRRHVINSKKKTELKAAIKAVRKLSAKDPLEKIEQTLTALYAIADKTAKAKCIKKNKAARIKSRATKLIASTARKNA